MARITVVIVSSFLLLLCSIQSAGATKRVKKLICTQKSEEKVDTRDTNSVQGAALKKQIGKRISFCGKYMGWRTGKPGLLDEKTGTEISFEALPVPRKRELILEYGVICDRENPDHTTVSVCSVGGEWYSKTPSSKRETKLRNLLKSLKENDVVTVTGVLCHVKVISIGDYKLFQQIPSSHFFFSVDDLTISSDKK